MWPLYRPAKVIIKIPPWCKSPNFIKKVWPKYTHCSSSFFCFILKIIRFPPLYFQLPRHLTLHASYIYYTHEFSFPIQRISSPSLDSLAISSLFASFHYFRFGIADVLCKALLLKKTCFDTGRFFLQACSYLPILLWPLRKLTEA